LIYLERGDERALDDALFTARRAADTLEAAHMPADPGLDEVRAVVAFARRDYTEAHRIFDRLGSRRAVEAPAITGRVEPPTSNAVVVAWRGELVGDPRRLYTRPGFVGDIATVEHDGTFTIHAEPGWAIMAEAGGARSRPQIVAAHPVLKLEPVTTISGSVKGPNVFGIQAYAKYKVGSSSWVMQVPVDRDASFDLRGLPPGERTFGLSGPAGTGQRTTTNGPKVLDVEWPAGQAIEVIVHGKALDPTATAWVLRHRKAPIATRAELDASVATSFDVASSALTPIGADNTDAGREVYRAGDRHAVIIGNYDDDYMVCVTTAAQLTCKPITVNHTVEVPYSDGRYAAGVTPIVFEL
jgi:hypothetical protein